REEESNFNCSGFRSDGTVYGVSVDAVSEVSTDGARISLFGVGRAHQLAILRDGVLAFQHLHEDGAGDHELNQILEEGALFVYGIETLGVAARELHQAGSHDLQTGLLKAGDDLTDHVLGDG